MGTLAQYPRALSVVRAHRIHQAETRRTENRDKDQRHRTTMKFHTLAESTHISPTIDTMSFATKESGLESGLGVGPGSSGMPSTAEMVQRALQQLTADSDQGTTLVAIKKHLAAEYELELTAERKSLIKGCLRQLLKAGKMVNLTGSGLNGHLQLASWSGHDGSTTMAKSKSKSTARAKTLTTDMVQQALQQLRADTARGTSLGAVKANIAAMYGIVLTTQRLYLIKRHLRQLLEAGDMVNINSSGLRGRFRLVSKRAQRAKSKTTTAVANPRKPKADKRKAEATATATATTSKAAMRTPTEEQPGSTEDEAVDDLELIVRAPRRPTRSSLDNAGAIGAAETPRTSLSRKRRPSMQLFGSSHIFSPSPRDSDVQSSGEDETWSPTKRQRGMIDHRGERGQAVPTSKRRLQPLPQTPLEF